MKFLLAFLFSFTVFAGPFPSNHCPVKPNLECEKHVISQIPWFDAKDPEELRKIKYACAGNQGDACVKRLSKDLPWYNTNNTEDLVRVAQSCALTNLSCVDYVTKRLSSVEYKDMEDVTAVARACARAEASCVDQACSNGELNCRQKDGLLRAARSCFEPCHNN